MSEIKTSIDTGEEIVVLKEAYESFKEDSDFLDCLKACGVDNWCGYDEACEMKYGEGE